MLGPFLKQSFKVMKAPVEVFPLVAVVSGASIGGVYMGFRKLATDPNLRTQASRTYQNTLRSISAQSNLPSSHLLQHRHSFISTLRDEPSDDNFKVASNTVDIIGLNGYREWEVKGSFEAFFAAAGKNQPQTVNDSEKVHVQWYDHEAPLLRPPFTPSFIPGFHLAITSDNFSKSWMEYCPLLVDLIGALDCQEYEELQLEDQMTLPVRSLHLIPINKHHYVHRNISPPGLLPDSSVVSSLISKQQAGTSGPALIDLVLQNGRATLKATWPIGANSPGGEETVRVSFNEKTDKVVEVGWFFREVTEKEDTVFDHFLGATVKLDAEGETVNEALIQSRSPVFPPHKKEFSTGKIVIPGHGFTSGMYPSQTLHPHSITIIRSNPYIADTTSDCELHVLQVLPSGVFVDPFQLEGLAPEIGQTAVFGETDLEKPVGVVSGWGSVVMAKAQPEDSTKTSRWIPAPFDTDPENNEAPKIPSYESTVDIPMHTRYQPPIAVGNPATHVNVTVPWPIVAWVCPTSRPSSDSGDNITSSGNKKLFHVPPLPLNLFFPEDSVDFRFVLPSPVPKQSPSSYVSVPVGRLDDLWIVRIATFVLAGAATLQVSFVVINKALNSYSQKPKKD
ncbi:protease B nonderepressible form [Entomortierella beljakovae]|nr:protease B nonderepressible form [Entomortierella beljakovae]